MSINPSSEEEARKRFVSKGREKNREHARKTRLRKKATLMSMQNLLENLKQEVGTI